MLGQLPQRALSRAFGRLADLPLPPRLRPLLLGAFARAVGIDVEEAELPLAEYPTLNAFFVRRLRSGARAWSAETGGIASPVDGVVGRFGAIFEGRAVQAKGHSYSIAALLADGHEAERFLGGSFLTIYLSPRHYHRIHTPCRGTIERATYIPGTLLPVNEPAVKHVPQLFARNERLLCYLDSPAGRVVIVAVGAYNVGRISAAFDPFWSGSGKDAWVTNRVPTAPLERSYHPPKRIENGAEIMAFHLGSTIVLLFESDVELSPLLRSGAEVRVGEEIARYPAD